MVEAVGQKNIRAHLEALTRDLNQARTELAVGTDNFAWHVAADGAVHSPEEVVLYAGFAGDASRAEPALNRMRIVQGLIQQEARRHTVVAATARGGLVTQIGVVATAASHNYAATFSTTVSLFGYKPKQESIRRVNLSVPAERISVWRDDESRRRFETTAGTPSVFNILSVRCNTNYADYDLQSKVELELPGLFGREHTPNRTNSNVRSIIIGFAGLEAFNKKFPPTDELHTMNMAGAYNLAHELSST